MLYAAAQFCIVHEKGDQNIARKVSNFYKGSKMSESQYRGVKALILGLMLLIKMKTETPHIYPTLIVSDSTRRKILKIQYSTEFPEQFRIIESLATSIEKDLQLHLENAKDYLIDLIWDNKIVIRKIIIQTDKKYPFYKEDIGVIWGSEECVGCVKTLEKYGIVCSKSDCDRKEARKKLRKLYLKYHPDKGGDPEVFNSIHKCAEEIVENHCLEKIRYNK